ncbi:caspase-3 [Callorhinchus milii]|uniref:Caspase-3-like n=1 Tax=Callorhinchus milii TaxID=7868 RepID=V9L8Q8_CALMI|nr:caspase-3 [Callorhinchus milii]|eukprot:gi/632984643/ref/XP_007909239.1/ PREDICTED: caspase-3-like [Callorhinchus milii]
MTEISPDSGCPRKPRVLIITVQQFHGQFPLRRRPFAAIDTKRLHNVLSNLGFEVRLKIDYTAREILQEYKRESQRQHGACFISIISSHGEDGVIYGADSQPVPLRHIYSLFTAQNSPSLAGKAKIFFIQACRGDQLDPGVTLETDHMVEMESALPQEEAFSHYQAIPEATAVHFSTTSDYSAFLTASGSFFFQSLCDLLEEGEQRHWELLRIMTRVNFMVATRFLSRGREIGGKKQMPCFVTKLTQEVFPFTDQQNL